MMKAAARTCRQVWRCHVTARRRRRIPLAGVGAVGKVRHRLRGYRVALTDSMKTSPIPNAPTERMRFAIALIELARPAQWIKNGFVLLPLFFAHAMLDADALRGALLATRVVLPGRIGGLCLQ